MNVQIHSNRKLIIAGLPGAWGKVTGNDNKRTQLFEGEGENVPVHNFVNILKITELNTSKVPILWHVNYISQYKNMRKKCHWPKDNFSVHQHIKRIINKMPNLLFLSFSLCWIKRVKEKYDIFNRSIIL